MYSIFNADKLQKKQAQQQQSNKLAPSKSDSNEGVDCTKNFTRLADAYVEN